MIKYPREQYLAQANSNARSVQPPFRCMQLFSSPFKFIFNPDSRITSKYFVLTPQPHNHHPDCSAEPLAIRLAQAPNSKKRHKATLLDRTLFPFSPPHRGPSREPPPGRELGFRVGPRTLKGEYDAMRELIQVTEENGVQSDFPRICDCGRYPCTFCVLCKASRGCTSF